MATGVTSPIPVTTTLRAIRDLSRAATAALLRVRLDVVDGVSDSLDLLGVLVGDLDLEILFERQYQLDHRQRVGLEVFGERGFGLHLVGRYLELLDDDLLDPVFKIFGHGLSVLSLSC